MDVTGTTRKILMKFIKWLKLSFIYKMNPNKNFYFYFENI